jgi:Ca2+-binding RTX toxin-like protein
LWDLAGGTVEEYHPGNSFWKPLMGSGALSDPSRGSTWMIGATSAGPNVIQDDLAVIGQENGFGFRPDDFSDTSATALSLTPEHAFVPTRYTAKGIIGQKADVDVFKFGTPGGSFQIGIDAAEFGPNLVFDVTIRSATGAVVASTGGHSTHHYHRTLNLAPGTYSLEIRSSQGLAALLPQIVAVGQYTVTLDFDQQASLPRLLPDQRQGVWDFQDKVLTVVGTNEDDVITLNRGKKGALVVMFNGIEFTRFAKGAVNEIVVRGLAGDDTITLDPKLAIKAFLSGDDGDDTLGGGKANDILLGGLGKDKLLGQKGRDILIGGLDSDTLLGGAHDDLLIAGTTAHDANPAAIRAVWEEWTAKRKYAQRIARLETGVDGLPSLNKSTVFDDGISDVLDGQAANDWFFAAAEAEVIKRARLEKLNM